MGAFFFPFGEIPGDGDDDEGEECCGGEAGGEGGCHGAPDDGVAGDAEGYRQESQGGGQCGGDDGTQALAQANTLADGFAAVEAVPIASIDEVEQDERSDSTPDRARPAQSALVYNRSRLK